MCGPGCGQDRALDYRAETVLVRAHFVSDIKTQLNKIIAQKSHTLEGAPPR